MPVERGVVRGSNKEGPGGDDRNNSFLPLGGGPATVHPANMPGAAGDRRNGSYPLTGGAPTVMPPNADKFRFNPDQVIGTGQPPSQVEPGMGSVPVNPFMAGGAAVKAMPASEMRKA